MLLGQKGFADATAVLGANWNVLEVGIAAAETACGRYGLVEIRMHAPGFGLHQLGQRIHVGAFEFAQHPMLQHQRHHGVVIRELVQHGGIGAVARFGAARFLAVQAQRLEEQLSQLLGRRQVEVHAGRLLGIGLESRQGLAHLLGEGVQIGEINADAGGFH